jgi:c-di-GMP-binding flagellar brake protein YcgR
VNAPAGRGSDPAGSTGRLLVRSGIEIGRTLEEIRAEGGVLTAQLGEEQGMFLTRLLQVDEAAGSIVVAYSESKQANAALLARETVVFSCNHGGLRHEFIVAEPRETEFSGASAIRFRFPTVLLTAQRRSSARIPVPPAVPLRCIIGHGLGSIYAQVVDVSRGGLGTLILNLAVRMTPGTRLEGVRIVHPERVVTVDLEVRHAAATVLRDGRAAMRVGGRFLAAPQDLDDLIRLFVTELDGGTGAS